MFCPERQRRIKCNESNVTHAHTSKVFFSGKQFMSRNNSRIFMFVCTTVLYEYMNLLRNEVYNLLVNTHVWIKIHRQFYHTIIYMANEGRRVRINVRSFRGLSFIWFHAWNNSFVSKQITDYYGNFRLFCALLEELS